MTTMTNLNWDYLENEIVSCRKCPRLVGWREEVANQRRRAFQDWDYWGRGVPGFGDRQARLLVVGLAPGAHGSNRTGRMFTGDASGDFLYPALYQAGFASQPESTHLEDGLTLRDAFITSSCRCAPPENKPTGDEMDNCRPYLLAELDLLKNLRGIVALGHVAFGNVLDIYRRQGYTLPQAAFTHAACYPLGDGLPWLIASYHPSRRNTQTGRLTAAMFDQVWQQARSLLERKTIS